MKKLAILGAVLISSVGLAQAPSSSRSSNASGNNPNQRICRVIGETGSRLGSNRVCMTRAQWEAQRRETRQDIEQSQSQRAGRQY